ncbi:hypothetical protein [Pseudomonas sp. MWU13-2100]|uniref:hypothetical protein n=1 Tax=Pseudomonas sp. MWU13-2100 TaxID=2935075 RepID=UPI00200F80D8|nr:hypothetical protein [Pseudomonas sp. MWU13-2100]
MDDYSSAKAFQVNALAEGLARQNSFTVFGAMFSLIELSLSWVVPNYLPEEVLSSALPTKQE